MTLKGTCGRKKLTPLPKLIKKLDDVFQMCIRYRDRFTCITCGKKFPWGEKTQLHAGHFIGRGNYSTRWDEENVNAECAGCNLKQSLADVEVIHRYAKELEFKYGVGTVERLMQKKHKPFKVTRAFLEENIEFYSKQLQEYENDKENN